MTIFTAEIIGTAILVLLGNGVVAAVVLNKSKAKNDGWLTIAAGWGIALMVAAYSVGRISGGHFNPAVSISLLTMGVITLKDFFVYVSAQFIGAMIGQLLIVAAYKKHYDETQNADDILGTFSTAPAVRSLFYNTLSEAIATFAFVFSILNVQAGMKNAELLFPIALGILLTGIILSLGSNTGCAVNPARDLGPRIVHALLPLKNKGKSDWQYALVPVIGPLLGGILAGLLFMFI